MVFSSEAMLSIFKQAKGSPEAAGGGSMSPRVPTRCKICGSQHDVRSDGLCLGCYDARQAALCRMSYGKHVCRYGHGYRRDKPPDVPVINCPICGNVFVPERRTQKYCSDVCRSRAQNLRRNGPQEDAKTHETCRGCKNHIPGSCVCTNRESPYYSLSWNKACEFWRRPDGPWRRSAR